jgi:hypothetical protein
VIYKVFKHLPMQWMAIWVHPYFIKPMEVCQAGWTWVTTVYVGVQVKSYLLQKTNLQDENFPFIGLRCLVQSQDVCFDILFGGFCNKQGRSRGVFTTDTRILNSNGKVLISHLKTGARRFSLDIYWTNFLTKFRGIVSHHFVIPSAKKK